MIQESDNYIIIGKRQDGKVQGPVWLLYDNYEGGLLTHLEPGTAHHKLSISVFTGDDVVWVYPDMTTVIRGQFVAGTLLHGHEGHVSHVTRTRDIPDITVTVDDDTEYKFDPSTHDHLSSSPMVRDPYERKYLDVRPSSVAGAGMGVFARWGVDKYQSFFYEKLYLDPS